MAPAKFSASNFIDDIRRYGATYMNYVGKPLAYILATPEQPDDARTPLRIAFGNEASDRDIEAFQRRFDCTVWDGFGSTENAVIITREEGTPKGSLGKGFPGVAIYNAETVTECPRARFDADGALINAEEAIGELVNTEGQGFFTGYYNAEDATAERMRHGMYWSGDLAYCDEDGWIYLAGRSGDWLRVDGENMAAAPIERILIRLPDINLVAVYAVPDENVGDQIMAALVLNDGAALTPDGLESFLAAQSDLSPKAWPRYVRIAPRPTDDRHPQGAQTRPRGAGPDARRRRAMGPRTARHPLHARLVLAQRPAEVGDRIPVLPGRTVQRDRVLAGVGTRVPVLPGRAVDGLGLRRTASRGHDRERRDRGGDSRDDRRTK